MPQTLFRVLAGVAAISAALIIAWFSLGPPPETPSAPFLNDKVMHFIAYFGLGGAAVCAMRAPSVALTAIGAGVYGGIIEIAQAVMPFGREGSILDAAANVAGAAAGAALGKWMTDFLGRSGLLIPQRP